METADKQNIERELVSKYYLQKYLRVSQKNIDLVISQLGIRPVVEFESGARYSLAQVIEAIRTVKRRKPSGRSRAYRQDKMKNN